MSLTNHIACIVPGPAEIQAAVDLAVELGVVEVEAEGLRPQGRLEGRLEVGQPLLRRGGILVEDEFHQFRVLEDVDLELQHCNEKSLKIINLKSIFVSGGHGKIQGGTSRCSLGFVHMETEVAL